MKETAACLSPNHGANSVLSEHRVAVSSDSSRSGCAALSVCLSPECFWSRSTASQLFVHARSCHHPVAGSHIIINTSSCNIQGNKVGYFHSYPVFELCDRLPLHPPLHALLCRAETCCVAVWDDCSCLGNNGWDGWITFCFLSPSVGSVRPSVTRDGGANLKGVHLTQQWHAKPYCSCVISVLAPACSERSSVLWGCAKDQLEAAFFQIKSHMAPI